VARDQLRELVPSFELDTFENEAWFGIVPLRMSDLSPRRYPASVTRAHSSFRPASGCFLRGRLMSSADSRVGCGSNGTEDDAYEMVAAAGLQADTVGVDRVSIELD
jgi:Uncharacterized conserved protein (COG2071)